jgi:hypothetical protein
MSTERCNSIAQLQTQDWNNVSNHNKMATIYWNSYRARMGTSKGTREQFDLDTILPLVEGMDFLTYSFSLEEMDNVTITLPTDKSPGSDGLTVCSINRDEYNLAR